MGASAKQRPVKKAIREEGHPRTGSVLYLYGVSLASAGGPAKMVKRGIDGNSPVDSLPVEGLVCWLSRVDRETYAEDLSANMESLEWLATASVRHQDVVGELSRNVELVPARFGTIFLDDESLRKHVSKSKPEMQRALRKIRGCEEWGIKVFRQPGTARPASVDATSGRDYLRQKAERLNPANIQDDPLLQAFAREMEEISQDVAPGGKASAGQPGLVWQRSFLVRKTARKKLTSVLKSYSKQFGNEYRIECSGPWPAYSFVGHHGL